MTLTGVMWKYFRNYSNYGMSSYLWAVMPFLFAANTCRQKQKNDLKLNQKMIFLFTLFPFLFLLSHKYFLIPFPSSFYPLSSPPLHTPSLLRRSYKTWYIYATEYSAVKNNDILKFSVKWTDLEKKHTEWDNQNPERCQRLTLTKIPFTSVGAWGLEKQ